MNYHIRAPQGLHTTVHLPASKSISARALVIAQLAGQALGTIDNVSDCDDTRALVEALTQRPEVVDVGASGTAMRFLTAYFAAAPGETHVLTGTERMRHRPIGILVDALRQMGADVEYEGEEGFPPLRIRGRQLSGGAIELPATVSSQYISALLLVAPTLEQGLTLHLAGNIISRPYIDLTLCMMRDFGAEAEWNDVGTISVASAPYQPRPYVVESDWSAASYWYEMMALSRGRDDEVRLCGLMDGSRQGDSSVRYVFSLLGVKTTFDTTEQGVTTCVTLRRLPLRVPRLDYDFSGQPDLAQTFVVCCCMMGVPFRFTGLSTLRIKETDRIQALQNELAKMGYDIEDVDNCTLEWKGRQGPASPHPAIDTYHDHRMAMSFAPACLRLPHITINDPQVVSKSYPAFWQHLQEAGFIIEEG